jgi:Protein of unknown function (DUF4031)
MPGTHRADFTAVTVVRRRESALRRPSGSGSECGWPGTPIGPQQVPVTGHYDVTEGERDQAVALGAQPVSPREADKRERRQASGLGDS